ncbi:uncharacterized protein PSFLO_02051 [Pseudozyma flocculosa]|uniref:Uncharacterized protein n=1 Tax=Pseudozyma flocculosa TaxID=84751 RepID=A0A5C3EXJ1_9BASI|nr:uncharacterized protein PSFLO_02051 [Pseudozyma flocculosa]
MRPKGSRTRAGPRRAQRGISGEEWKESRVEYQGDKTGAKPLRCPPGGQAEDEEVVEEEEKGRDETRRDETKRDETSIDAATAAAAAALYRGPEVRVTCMAQGFGKGI